MLCTGRAPASGTGPGVPACPQDTICLVSRHAFYNLPLQWCPAALGVFLWLWHFPLSTQVNDWQEDWVTFYARQRIQPQMDMVEKGSGDREARELWSALQVRGASPGPASPAGEALWQVWPPVAQVWTGGGLGQPVGWLSVSLLPA